MTQQEEYTQRVHKYILMARDVARELNLNVVKDKGDILTLALMLMIQELTDDRN